MIETLQAPLNQFYLYAILLTILLLIKKLYAPTVILGGIYVIVLQKKGFVVRKKSNSDDARELNIYATKQGKAIHKELESLGDELYQTMISKIGEKELKQLVGKLRDSANKIE